MSNLPVILTGLTGSALLVYVGITDPPGGVSGVLTGVFSGKGVPGKVKGAAYVGGSLTETIAYTLAGGRGAAGAGTSSGVEPSAYTTGASPRVSAAIHAALSQLGVAYKYGGTGPASGGWDCSSLMQYAYKAAGVNLPRTTYQQILVGSHVSRANLAPGDLVFPDAGHVQMYLGAGQIVEAPHTGETVHVSQLGGVWAARRIITAAPTSGTVNL